LLLSLLIPFISPLFPPLFPLAYIFPSLSEAYSLLCSLNFFLLISISLQLYLPFLQLFLLISSRIPLSKSFEVSFPKAFHFFLLHLPSFHSSLPLLCSLSSLLSLLVGSLQLYLQLLCIISTFASLFRPLALHPPFLQPFSQLLLNLDPYEAITSMQLYTFCSLSSHFFFSPILCSYSSQLYIFYHPLLFTH